MGALAAFVIILVKLFRKSAAPHVLDSFSIMSEEQFMECYFTIQSWRLLFFALVLENLIGFLCGLKRLGGGSGGQGAEG